MLTETSSADISVQKNVWMVLRSYTHGYVIDICGRVCMCPARLTPHAEAHISDGSKLAEADALKEMCVKRINARACGL